MSEWADIPQTLAATRKPVRAATVRLCLATYGRANSSSLLTITVPPDAAEALGWARGTRLGAQIGTSERTAGWLRVAPSATGRVLRSLPKASTFMAHLAPPEPWRRLTAPSLPVEHRIQGNALLVQIPWDMDNLPAEPGEEEAA